MRRDLTWALDDCLARMQTGVSIKDCMARYPEFAGRLGPLLEVAAAVQGLPRPAARQAAIEAGEQRMMAAMAQRDRSRPVPSNPLSRYAGQLVSRILGKENLEMKLVLRFALAILVGVLILGGSGLTVASASALPGDALYPMKRSTESLRLLLAFDPQTRGQLETKFQETRRQEVQAVVETGREVDVRFWGELTQVDDNGWTVGGLRTMRQGNTQIVGQPTIGAMVEVRATTQRDGTIVVQALSVQNPPPDGTPINPLPPSGPTRVDDDDDDDTTPEATHTPKPTSVSDDDDDDHTTPGATRTPRPTSVDDDDDDDDDDHTPTATRTPHPTSVDDDDDDDDDGDDDVDDDSGDDDGADDDDDDDDDGADDDDDDDDDADDDDDDDDDDD